MSEPDKKKNIMEQSKQLFEKFGYQKTTLSDIARSVGKVKSAIYYYFSGKEEIFASLVEAEATDFLTKLMKEVSTADKPSEQLRIYVDTRVSLMQDLTKRYYFLKDEFFELIPIVEENRKNCDEQEVLFLTEILERANQEESAEIADPKFSATLLMQNIKGLEVQMFVTDTVQAHIQNREAFIDFILYGILNK